MNEKSNQEFRNASGRIPYHMTNDYLFRAVLQSNNKALRGLVCSLLHLSEKEVHSVEIANPIVLGEAVRNKEFRLDINVVLNNNTLINLEMQIANKLNWRERSVMYLCRSFDQLNHGQDYSEVKPVVHIGFLNYTLFEDTPEFYTTYKLINVKSNREYTDSLTLHVIDLSHIELASEEDRKYHIHEWAMLFKADTWEEIRMIASKDKYLEEYYQDLSNYERAIEEGEKKRELESMEHEQDLRNYERAIEEGEKKRELERMEHEQERMKYETALREQAEQIRRLSEEIERLKKQ